MVNDDVTDWKESLTFDLRRPRTKAAQNNTAVLLSNNQSAQYPSAVIDLYLQFLQLHLI